MNAMVECGIMRATAIHDQSGVLMLWKLVSICFELITERMGADATIRQYFSRSYSLCLLILLEDAKMTCQLLARVHLWGRRKGLLAAISPPLESLASYMLIYSIPLPRKPCFLRLIPYGRKFWRGIYFGGLTVLRAIRQYFIHQNLCDHIVFRLTSLVAPGL